MGVKQRSSTGNSEGGAEVSNNLVCETMKCTLVPRTERGLRGWAGPGGSGEDLDPSLGVTPWICALAFLCIALLNPAASLWLRTSSKSKQRALSDCLRRKTGDDSKKGHP